jgi:hypothetical protein
MTATRVWDSTRGFGVATRPGTNPTFDMAAFNAREQRIIRRLARHFYITRAANITQVGNSNYRSLLMRPAEDVSVALNVEREVAVLFAEYETFEARTLRAFDLTYDQFDDIRVDRSLRFLVSGDSGIEGSIRHYLLQNPEYPIVVPFHYDHFLDQSDDFFFDAIRKNYLIRDLFGYQSPLKHEYFFFGRSRLVESVIDLHKSGQNSGLFGLRKSGKTSTIYAIQRRAKTAGCRTLVVDCQDPAVHARTYSALLEYIVARARTELSLKKIDTSLGSSPVDVSENFRRVMNQTLGDAQSDLLLIFDEIENISPQTAASGHWRNSTDSLLLWQTLRSYFQSPIKFRLTFCFVGTNPHLFEMPKINGVDNPVYLFAPKTFIPMLSISETSEMIKRLGYFMGLDFDGNVIAYIHSRFGGHPFFTRQLCSQLHQRATTRRPHRVSLSECEVAERNVGSDIMGYLNEILNSLRSFYPDEYNMLEYLALDEKDTFADLAAYSPAFVEHLIGYGIVIRRGDDHEFSFNAVAGAVKANLTTVKDSTLEEKRQEVGRRRNTLEEEIRSFLYRSAVRLSDETWSQRLSDCLSKNRLSELGVLSRRTAFSKTKSPLYFTELLKFVEVSNEFDKNTIPTLSQVLSSMHLVNKNRIDAHAGDITDSDFVELMQSMELLEGTFLPP